MGDAIIKTSFQISQDHLILLVQSCYSSASAIDYEEYFGATSSYNQHCQPLWIRSHGMLAETRSA